MGGVEPPPPVAAPDPAPEPPSEPVAEAPEAPVALPAPVEPQPVVKPRLHSTGDASPLAALLLP